MSEVANEKINIAAQFYYFGISCFYRTSVGLAKDSALKTLTLNDIVLSSIKEFQDMNQLGT